MLFYFYFSGVAAAMLAIACERRYEHRTGTVPVPMHVWMAFVLLSWYATGVILGWFIARGICHFIERKRDG